MDAAGRILPKMESVACVLPGLLAQGVLHGVTDTERTRRNHLALARELLETCWVTYASTPTHLAAEIVRFGPDRDPPHRGRAKHAHRTPRAAAAAATTAAAAAAEPVDAAVAAAPMRTTRRGNFASAELRVRQGEAYSLRRSW